MKIEKLACCSLRCRKRHGIQQPTTHKENKEVNFFIELVVASVFRRARCLKKVCGSLLFLRLSCEVTNLIKYIENDAYWQQQISDDLKFSLELT